MSANDGAPTLQVEDLETHFFTKAGIAKARAFHGALFERRFRFGILRLYRPGEHHEAVFGLDPD